MLDKLKKELDKILLRTILKISFYVLVLLLIIWFILSVISPLYMNAGDGVKLTFFGSFFGVFLSILASLGAINYQINKEKWATISPSEIEFLRFYHSRLVASLENLSMSEVIDKMTSIEVLTPKNSFQTLDEHLEKQFSEIDKMYLSLEQNASHILFPAILKQREASRSIQKRIYGLKAIIDLNVSFANNEPQEQHWLDEINECLREYANQVVELKNSRQIEINKIDKALKKVIK